MQLIIRTSKSLIIAFSITCCVLFFWQNGSPIFTLHYSSYEQERDIAIDYQIPSMKSITSIEPIPNKIAHDWRLDISSETLMKPSTPIWAKIGKQLNLDHASQNPRVQAQIREILTDKKSFEATLNRSAPYIYYIYQQTQQRHLPAELALIPIIESEYNPNDHNSIDALGLWQLMPQTARDLGVKMNNGYDGRRNVVDSTKAALTFLTDLNTEFKGNWNLSFAAYNCGPGCISSAVKRAKSDDYFDLKLPLETKLYVPRLLAVAVLIKHAQEYGITLPEIKDEPYFSQVQVQKSESLSDYAKSNGTDLEMLKKLNPNYRSETSISSSKPLLVPVTSKAI